MEQTVWNSFPRKHRGRIIQVLFKRNLISLRKGLDAAGPERAKKRIQWPRKPLSLLHLTL